MPLCPCVMILLATKYIMYGCDFLDVIFIILCWHCYQGRLSYDKASCIYLLSPISTSAIFSPLICISDFTLSNCHLPFLLFYSFGITLLLSVPVILYVFSSACGFSDYTYFPVFRIYHLVICSDCYCDFCKKSVDACIFGFYHFRVIFVFIQYVEICSTTNTLLILYCLKNLYTRNQNFDPLWILMCTF